MGLPGRILHGLWTMAQVARAHTEAGDGPRRAAAPERAVPRDGPPEREVTVTGEVVSVTDGIATVHAVAEQDGKAIIRNAEADLATG